jgi:DMSO/TMAO reductase YedYZ molybdopterin-dependent catalytic subunit
VSNNRCVDRRRVVIRGGLLIGAFALGGCHSPADGATLGGMLDLATALDYRIQRLLLPTTVMAPEYSPVDISPTFRTKGSTHPNNPVYLKLARDNFDGWRLRIDGLVDRPASYSLRELRELPSRTQITRHDCVDGWSCIGKWKGVPLGPLLDRSGLKSQARYIVFHCADTLGYSFNVSKYYESVGLDDAYQAQTILAYDMNDAPLKIEHGAPVRLRVERQLGYKMAKFVMRVEAVASFAHIEGGKGGYWEDRGYAWYAGI